MSTDTTTVQNPAETTNNRRNEPPVLVYVRIRPFIGDELARGENQNMLCIRDEKRIAVKLYPTATNNIRPAQTSYNEYEVSKIFDHRCTQQELFEQTLEQATDEVFTGSNWLLCTLGLTNSGKTHTMFGTPKDPGLIPQCLQRMFLHVGYNIDKKVLFKPDGLENLVQTNMNNLQEEINARKYIFKDDKDDHRRNLLHNIVQDQSSILDDHSVEDEHYSIWISFFELYNENIMDLLVKPSAMKKRKALRLMQNNDSTIIKDLVQIPVFDLKEAEDTIRFGYANRATSKTELNEASSRSHAILCITLITFDEFEEEPTMSHMYICDLAGNEPTTGTGKLLAETVNINTSLMTFKDCIRVLNENQNSRKQMLLPYRNSVLTSIFRPFFIGRGRTIICCNVNPCATFISQTNELLKFSALAQKTIIVPQEAPVKKVVVESKIKGPKRLAQANRPIGYGKKKNHQTGDSDDIEDCSPMIIDGHSIPTDVNSINFWKFATKRALDVLEKQAAHRRTILTEQNKERIRCVEIIFTQREQIDDLTLKTRKFQDEIENLNRTLTSENEKKHFLKEKQNELEKKIHDLNKKHHQSQDDNENLRSRLKTLQEKFDCMNCQYNNLIEQNRQSEQNHFNEKSQINEQLKRMKNEFENSKNEKLEKNKIIEQLNEKLLFEQKQNEKILNDLSQMKNEMKSVHSKYDALQVELLQVRAAKNNETVAVRENNSSMPNNTRLLRSKRSANEEELQENKKPKPGTPDRSVSAANILRKPSNRKIPTKINNEEERRPTPPTTLIKDVKSKSTSVLKKRPLAPSNSADSPLVSSKLIPEATTSPIELQPASIVGSPAIGNTLSPKPSTIQRFQSLFKNTPPSNRTITQLKSGSTGMGFGSTSPLTASPIAVLQKTSLAMRKQTPKRRYRLRNRVNSNQ